MGRDGMSEVDLLEEFDWGNQIEENNVYPFGRLEESLKILHTVVIVLDQRSTLMLVKAWLLGSCVVFVR